MEAQPDYKELLELFNAQGVEFLIVGAYALAFYGAPRTTGDINLLVHSTPDNAARVVAALDAFGFGSLGLTTDDFQTPDQVIQLGVPPVRIDILTSLSGVTWNEANEGKEPGNYGDVPVFFIGKTEYIKNKKATGRKKDEADVEALGQSGATLEN